MESMDVRKNALEKWLLEQCGLTSYSCHPLVNDASFRRYFRLYTTDGSFIAMDAPPPQENCTTYVAIANALSELGLNTPEILKADLDAGFLLITDFGDLTYLKVLNEKNVDHLYALALRQLAILQGCSGVKGHRLPDFDAHWMQQEWSGHQAWFLQRLLKINSLPSDVTSCFGQLIESALKQPQVFMHRDFHAGNLMVLPYDELGILDFQDAFLGPVTYDAVSLLRDCYLSWPEDQIRRHALFYRQMLIEKNILQDISEKLFLRWFDLMGVQRHIKALFTFARKAIRDRQRHYLQHVPRTLDYIVKVTARYPELKSMHDFYAQTVTTQCMQQVDLCVQ